MKGNYKQLNRYRGLIQEWQGNVSVHPLTCGNDSNHKILAPELTLLDERANEFQLLVVCVDCNWKQDIPAFFMKLQIIFKSHYEKNPT